MQKINKEIVLSVLAHHVGKGHGISVKQLSARLGTDARSVRHWVTALRFDGHAVCGTPRDGYYIAATADELNETCEFIHSRSMHGLLMEARMKKIPLPDLLGQLHVPT